VDVPPEPEGAAIADRLRPGLSERDSKVVSAIEAEGLEVFAFDGLRRITGAHPETLSRILARLEEDGIVVRSPDGYATTAKTKGLVQPGQASPIGSVVPILHTYLPNGASLEAVVRALKGRWFGRMRWLGASEDASGAVLKWVADDGSTLIEARFSPWELEIGAKTKRDSDLPGAILAAHQLVGRISTLYPAERGPGRPRLFRAGYFAPAM
jgi:hypothetical protein